MNESTTSDQELAELLSLNVGVNVFGATMYRNHLGQLHRTHGPAVILVDGGQLWYQNGLRHRTGGPASIYHDGDEWWYQLGQLHRTDGPAVIYPGVLSRWFLHDKELTEEEWNERVKSV